MKFIAPFAFGLTILLFSGNLLALSPKDYTFQLSPATRELAQQSVRTVYQDRKGFIWLLTQEGLHRFDGYSVTRFRASNRDPKSISHQSTTGIVEDNEGYLWISTAGGGLNRYNPADQSFTAIKAREFPSTAHPLSNDIYTVFIDSQGYIWLGYGIGSGFSRFSPKTRTFEHFPPAKHSSVTRAVSFTETSDGAIWALIDGLGLLKILQADESIEAIQIPSPEGKSNTFSRLNHVMTSREGDLWISSLDSGIVRYSPKTQNFEYFGSTSAQGRSLSDETVYMTMEDQSKNIWAATRSGVSVWQPDSRTFTWLNSTNSNIPDNQVFNVFQSRSGIIWIGTYNGLAYGTKSLFKRIDSAVGPPNDSINAFAQDKDGTIWVGSNTGLHVYDPSNLTQDYYFPQDTLNERLSSVQVMSLFAEGTTLWVGTLDSGLNRIDLPSGKIEVYRRRVTDPNSISANGITSITRTSDGLLLIGTYGGGLNVFNERTGGFTHYQWDADDSSSISSNNVVAIVEDRDRNIWIGTENGINFFDRESGRFQRFTSDTANPESLSSNLAWALHEDGEGDLWIGTQSGGLNKWSSSDKRNKTNRFSQYLENIGLPSADIYAITSDKNSDIWISHNRGLTRISSDDISSEHFDLTDGLQGSEFNHGAVFKDKNSRLYFGGNNGFNTIEPDFIQRNMYSPPVQITEYRMLNEEIFFDVPYDQVKQISLPYNFRYASFTFASLDYTNPSLNQYRYMLQGFDNSWIELGKSRTVSFTSLPAGSYVFRLQGTNSDGIWSEKGVEFGLNVTPAPWFSIQAYFAYTIAVLSVIYLITMNQRAKSALAIKRQRELELKVQERTVDLEEARNVAERANKSKSDFLATVTHEIRTPMHGMIGMTELLLHTKLSDQQRKFANAAHASGESLLQLINSILDFSKIEADRVEVDTVEFDLIKLLDDICYLQSEPASRKSLDFLYEVKSSFPASIIGDPTKIRQVIINLTSNAIKFTEQGFVRVAAEWRYDPDSENIGRAIITVDDTGIGMDKNAKEKMFEAFTQADASTTRKYGGTGLGLAISKRFIDLLSGEILVDSEQGHGTKITVSLPVAVGTQKRLEFQEKGHSIIFLSKNTDTMQAVTSHLKLANYEFISCTSALDAINASSPNSILLADYDYFKTADAANAFTRSCRTNKTILLCPLRLDTSSLRLNFSHFITKPLTTGTLAQHIEELSQDEVEINSTLGKQVRTKLNSELTKKTKVLVAEDLETNQKIVKEILEMYGCDVLIVDDGYKAYQQAQAQKFDIIFVDCQMPNMDGYEATRSIRDFELRESQPRTPIVALTAGNTNEEMQRGFSAGMDKYLTKPFKIEEIRKVLESFSLKTAHTERAFHEADSSQVKPALETESKDSPTLDVINMGSIENIMIVERQTGNRILPKLFLGFQEQMEEKLSDLTTAMEEGNIELAYSTAHAIKSMSANLGAEKVRVISADAERKFKVGDIAGLADNIVKIELAYREFLVHAEELIQTPI